MKKKILTLSEAAQRVGRTEKALRGLIFRGKFPFSKISGKVGVDEGELERFLELSKRVTAEEAAGREAA